MTQIAPAYRPSKNLAFSYAVFPDNIETGNADAYLIFPSNSTYAHPNTAARPIWYALLADGAGADAKGRVASQLAVEVVYKELIRAAGDDEDEILYHLEDAFKQAHLAIKRNAADDASLQDMAAAALAGALVQNRLYLAYAGDSCAYLVRNGVAVRLTLHAPAPLSRGHDAKAAAAYTSPPAHEPPASHPLLGQQEVAEVNSYLHNVAQLLEPQSNQRPSLTDYLELQADDVILFCSGALAATLADQEIAQIVMNHSIDEVAEQLIARARELQTDVNAAALVIEWKGEASFMNAAPPTRRRFKSSLYLSAAALLIGLLAVYYT